MPKVVDHEQRRREIADGALKIIAEAGVTAVTFRNLATATGWPVGVLNHYFAHRRDLLMSALTRAAQLSGERQRAVTVSLTGLEALVSVLDEELPKDRDRIAMSRIFLFFYAEAANDEEAREIVTMYLRRWRRRITLSVEEAQEAGEIDPDLDARDVAADLIAYNEGLGLHMLLDPDAMSRVVKNPPTRAWVRRLSA
jgi:AcrR family transcriptional regulator